MQQGQHWGLHGSVLLQPPWELLPVELRGWRSAGRAVWTQNARSGEGDSELLMESWRWGGDRGAGRQVCMEPVAAAPSLVPAGSKELLSWKNGNGIQSRGEIPQDISASSRLDMAESSPSVRWVSAARQCWCPG